MEPPGSEVKENRKDQLLSSNNNNISIQPASRELNPYTCKILPTTIFNNLFQKNQAVSVIF